MARCSCGPPPTASHVARPQAPYGPGLRVLRYIAPVWPASTPYSETLIARDAVAVSAPPRVMEVLQMPHVPGEPWIGGPGTPLAGRVALVVASPAGEYGWDGDLAGLVVDEWVETVPLEQETTSLSFHYDGPTATAPQAALLCVEPNPDFGWQETRVLAHIEEAIALAELRGVDLDLLGAGQLLPPLITAESSEGAGIGIELTESVAP